jgi:uncharacterized protein
LAKARVNRAKHGVDFEEAATVFLDPLLLVLADLEHSEEEERWKIGKAIAAGRDSHR